jgi:K+-transporting ATPase ATPase C chain
MNTKNQMNQLIRPAIVSLIILTLITGVLYPLLITGVAQVIFPHQANGSLITNASGSVIGSELIGQDFGTNPGYFWGRISATGGVPYNAAASSGSNLGPLNPGLIGADGEIQTRIDALKAADTIAGITNTLPIPVDLVTSSGSGLDPQISPAAAQYQIARIAALRKTDVASIQALVDQNTQGRTLGLLGEPAVNVLQLNVALDAKYPLPAATQ